MPLFLIPILPHTPAEVKVSSENGPPNSHVGGIDFLLKRVLKHPISFINPDRHASIRTLFETCHCPGAC
jgi:hypothetical protein